MRDLHTFHALMQLCFNALFPEHDIHGRSTIPWPDGAAFICALLDASSLFLLQYNQVIYMKGECEGSACYYVAWSHGQRVLLCMTFEFMLWLLLIASLLLKTAVTEHGGAWSQPRWQGSGGYRWDPEVPERCQRTGASREVQRCQKQTLRPFFGY